MFKSGYLYYISNFEFNNGDDPKDKYFIVLKEIDGQVIIGSLPTRKNKVPAFVNVDHGCINLEERKYNCFYFKKDKCICDTGFGFPIATFIYGGELEYYEKEIMESKYELGVSIKEEGKLNDEEFDAIMECLKNSNSVKRGIKKHLA